MLGKQQTEKISCKTNLYSNLLHSVGWSHTIALQPQGGFFQPSCIPVLMDDPWAYSTLRYNRPYSLTLCQHSLTRNQPCDGSHLPQSLRESNRRLSAVSSCFLQFLGCFSHACAARTRYHFDNLFQIYPFRTILILCKLWRGISWILCSPSDQ